MGTNVAERMSLMGRPLPAMDVSYPVAQVVGQLSGVEIARPTGASRPQAVRRRLEEQTLAGIGSSE